MRRLTLNIQQILEHSIYIITKYYDNEITPFLESMHEEVLWLGPSDKHRIETKALLVDTFAKENNNLRFSLYDMSAECIYHTRTHCEILVNYIVDSFYPDESIIRCNQRVHLSWQNAEVIDNDGVTTIEPRIRVCNISNSIPYDSRDTIYPIHFASHPFAKGFLLSGDSGQKLKIKGKGNAVHYILESMITYISNSDHNATIHTVGNDFVCACSLSELEDQLPDYFVRCHSSYMVNAKFVKNIKRFRVALEDGNEIPIPEKKYTKVRDEIERKIRLM